MIDLSHFDVAELTELIADARQELAKRQQVQVQAVHAEILRLAASIGMSVEEVLATGAVGKKGAAKAGIGRTVPPKYRDPDQAGNTWTGRGRPPHWVSQKLATGVSLSDLLIPSSGA